MRAFDYRPSVSTERLFRNAFPSQGLRTFMPNPIQASYQTAPGSSASLNLSAPDLTKFPPRSPRVRLGGFAHFPRMIDKARAFAAGTNGEYHYNCPIDQRLFTFSGVNPDAFLVEVKAGKTDSELLAYFMANLQPKRQPFEIAEW